jgi:hypothetical protein
MKLNGGTFLLRIELERERGLTNAEWRLWFVYRSLCGWDKKKAGFGIADITIAGLQKYLDWSTGSICSTRQSLVAKNKLKKIQGSKYQLVDAEKLLKPNFRQAEVSVQGIEDAVQYIEKKRTPNGFSHGQKGFEILDLLGRDFQPAEFGDVTKETIKKDKEIREKGILLEEDKKETPPWLDPERTRRFRETFPDKKVEN